MNDLNDYSFFAHVVQNGGFAAAARALREPKSKLSRRVARLEAELGVRLIERTSRRFRVTDVGSAFYERCRAMLEEAERAHAVVSDARREPHGVLRVACPTGLIEGSFSQALLSFVARYPKVSLRLYATNRRIDLIEERIDLAVRVRRTFEEDASLMMKPLRKSRRLLVCAPQLARKLRRARRVDELQGLPTITMGEITQEDRWELVGPNGASATFEHEPRVVSLDLGFLRAAAIDGLGVALLPDDICLPACQNGRLVHVLPEWHAPEGIVHLVFTARRGLPPAVRLLIDELVARFGEEPGAASSGNAIAREPKRKEKRS